MQASVARLTGGRCLHADLNTSGFFEGLTAGEIAWTDCDHDAFKRKTGREPDGYRHGFREGWQECEKATGGPTPKTWVPPRTSIFTAHLIWNEFIKQRRATMPEEYPELDDQELIPQVESFPASTEMQAAFPSAFEWFPNTPGTHKIRRFTDADKVSLTGIDLSDFVGSIGDVATGRFLLYRTHENLDTAWRLSQPEDSYLKEVFRVVCEDHRMDYEQFLVHAPAIEELRKTNYSAVQTASEVSYLIRKTT